MTRQAEYSLFNPEPCPLDKLKNDVNRVQALAGREIRAIIGSKAKDILPKDFPQIGKTDIEEIYPTNSPDLKYIAVYKFGENQIDIVMRTISRICPADTGSPNPKLLPIPRNIQPEESLRSISDAEWIKYGPKVIKTLEKIAMENSNGKKE